MAIPLCWAPGPQGGSGPRTYLSWVWWCRTMSAQVMPCARPAPGTAYQRPRRRDVKHVSGNWASKPALPGQPGRGSWPMALHFALQDPERLECWCSSGARCGHDEKRHHVLEARLPEITIPTLVVIEAEAPCPYADVLTDRLPRCTQVVVSDATPSASSVIPALRLGHAVMRFLLDCRGAHPS